MIIRYFKYEDMLPSEELTQEESAAQALYYKAYYPDADSGFTHAEAIRNGEIILTIYSVDDVNGIAAVLNTHKLQNIHTNVKVVLKREKQTNSQLCYFYDKSLTLMYAIRYYFDRLNYSVKEETLDTAGNVKSIQRHYYSATGEMLYTFEYDSAGALFNVYDYKQQGNVSFDAITDVTDKQRFLDANGIEI